MLQKLFIYSIDWVDSFHDFHYKLDWFFDLVRYHSRRMKNTVCCRHLHLYYFDFLEETSVFVRNLVAEHCYCSAASCSFVKVALALVAID